MRYHVKSEEVDAVQWDGINEQDVVDLTDGGSAEVVGHVLVVNSGTAVVNVELNGWLVKPQKGLPGTVYALVNETFQLIFRR